MGGAGREAFLVFLIKLCHQLRKNHQLQCYFLYLMSSIGAIVIAVCDDFSMLPALESVYLYILAINNRT